MEFSRQDYWSRLLFSTPGNLLDPGIKPASPALAGGFFTLKLSWLGEVISFAEIAFGGTGWSRKLDFVEGNLIL